jgi:hypothetical protein
LHYPDVDDLTRFPVEAGFAVELREAGEGGLHVHFVRSIGGPVLAQFPAWDHADRDLRHFTPYDVPIGSIDEPFDEADDSWRIKIFEHGGYVYVLQGDEPHAEEFATFFKVPRDQYLQAWAFVIDAYNPITPLDDAS